MFFHLEKKTVAALLAVLALTFISFSPCLGSKFMIYLDDNWHLTQNPLVRSLDLKAIFTSTINGINGIYIPLTTLSFAVEHHFFKLDPFVYHLDNLILHLFVTAMVFCLSLRMGLSRIESFWASLLFGIHPMHVESVAWVTERKDVLYASFYMLALYSYAGYVKTPSRLRYITALVLGLLSLLAKPMALSLVFILFLFDWFYARKVSWERKVAEKIPFIVYTVLITWLSYRHYVPIAGHDIPQAVGVWIWTWIFYIRQFIFPFVFIPLYPWPQPISFLNPHYSLSFLTGVVLFVWIYRYRKNRLVPFAFIFYFASIFFLLRTGTETGVHVVADRFMYLPSLGFCLLCAVLIKNAALRLSRQAVGKRRFFYAGMLASVLFLGTKTNLQTRLWKDELTLWNYTIPKVENTAQAPVAYNNRGALYLDEDKLVLALADFNKSISIDPEVSAHPYYNRAVIYSQMEYFHSAIQDYTHAISIDPAHEKSYHERGLAFYKMGQYDLALADFTRALGLNPDNPQYYYEQSLALKKNREYKSTRENLRGHLP